MLGQSSLFAIGDCRPAGLVNGSIVGGRRFLARNQDTVSEIERRYVRLATIISLRNRSLIGAFLGAQASTLAPFADASSGSCDGPAFF